MTQYIKNSFFSNLKEYKKINVIVRLGHIQTLLTTSLAP